MSTLTPRAGHRSLVRLIALAAALLSAQAAFAQDNQSAKSKEFYDKIKTFSLTGGSAEAKALVLKRDRASMTFDGTFYFTPSIDGHVTGAVFIGEGKFSAEVPPSEFEQENVKRLLKTDIIESDFKTAVLRFSDDTFDLIGKNRQEGGAANERAQKLATEVESKILKETGANLAARVALSILNSEKPGFFCATFEGGKRGRFSFLLDYQNRIPVAYFEINGGEKGLIFHYKSAEYFNEIWMAFYGLEDYQRGQVTYSDVNDLIDIAKYDMDLDLRQHKRHLGLRARITSQVRYANLRAVSFQIGESLSEEEDQRLKKQLRVKSVHAGGVELAAIQEDWEGGFTVFLPEAAQTGQQLELEINLEGDFMYDSESVSDCHYPRSNETWFPRHGYLDRATFDLTYRHPKKLLIASSGLRLSEEPDPEDKNTTITKYRMDYPVSLVTFALGPWERHKDVIKWEKGGEPTPLEFNSLPGAYKAIKEDFILAELSNSVRYFSLLFGKYPYPVFSATFHPFNFGQGFPTLLMIPNADRASKYTYSFIAHETSHQWWGGLVAWRSYRDQWLSEGFAEYSGILYTGVRDGAHAREDLLGDMRSSLKDPVLGVDGLRKGKLVDVGPIILGHRLVTTKTVNAYTTLIYNKGALVLRMLHFLFTDPASGDDKAFFAMMSDFVQHYHDSYASTDDFRAVANEHFARTPIARQFGITDLNWFFKQWVYQAGYPTYELQYEFQDEPGGKVLMTGTITQDNVPENWFMVLPIVFSFGEKHEGGAAIRAYGPKSTFKLRLPMRPKKVELDPHHWIISEKTSTKGG
jgi:peptidase M1-like protein